jgi:GT2 family glycosyltransferase
MTSIARIIPDVSIILVNWNTRDLILACLEALPQAIGNLLADVWVVDNASVDGSVPAIRERHPEVSVIENSENSGFAAANNQAIMASAGRYVLLLNSDTIPLPSSIEHLVRFAGAQPRAGIIGAQLLNPDHSFQGSYADFPSLASELLSATGLGVRIYGDWYPNYGPQHSGLTRRVDWVQGACMLARRAAVAHVGCMDEQYFMYSEETDWCLRMWRAGWEVWYLPEAQIIHYGGQSTRQVREAMVRALYRSKVRFFRKHYSRTAAAILQAVLAGVLSAKQLGGAFSTPRASNISSAPRG